MTRLPVMKDVKVEAILSTNRLTFSGPTHLAYKVLLPLGIAITKGEGVFWGQELSRLIEDKLDACDYILTLDYDTIFYREHVIRLLQLALEYPEADAIFPVQMRRVYDYPMMQRKPEKEGQTKIEIKIEEFQKPLTPMVAGHFGLTLLKAESLKKFTRPWFLPVPDKDGKWGDGRKDEDTYFWYKFNDEGFKAFVAPEVRIGHLVEMCIWPDAPEKGFAPIYTHLKDVEKGTIPSGCIPKIN